MEGGVDTCRAWNGVTYLGEVSVPFVTSLKGLASMCCRANCVCYYVKSVLSIVCVKRQDVMCLFF